MKTAPPQLSADWSRAASAARAEEDFGGGKQARPLRPVASLPPCTLLSVLRWGQGWPTAGSRSRLPRNTLGVPRVIPKEEKLILSEVTWNLDIKIFQRTHMNLNLVSCGITYQSVEEAP